MKGHPDKNVTLYSLIAAFGGFVFGLDAANLSGAIRFISSYFELSSGQVGLAGSITLIGVIFALFFTGTLCEKYGRKRVLIGIALAYTASSIISALSVNYEMLVVGRFIGGAAFASITVSAMYIGEIAPADKRGKFVSVNQFMIALGLLLAFLINYFLVKNLDGISWLYNDNVWRFMLGAELIANIIWVSLLLLVPESPRWLMMKGREEEARPVFALFVGADEVDSTVAEVRDSVDSEEKTSTLIQLKMLFSKKMSLILAIAVVYAIAQGGSGMNAILFFAPMIFEQVGMSVEDTFVQTVVMGLVGLVATVFAIFTVEKLGRRMLTLTGLFLVFVAHSSAWFGFSQASYVVDEVSMTKIEQQLEKEQIDLTRMQSLAGKSFESDVELKKALAGIYTNKELPLVNGPVINATIQGVKPAFVLVGIFVFLAAFNLSIGPIMWVIFSEVFPNSVRSVALPVAALVQTISSFMITQTLPWHLENFGISSVYVLYAGVGLVGLIAMSFILPETRGKSIEAIEKQLVKA